MQTDRRNIKYEYHETYKKTAHYVQMPCNLAAIVEHQSDYIKFLTDKVERLRGFLCVQQHNCIEDDAGNKSGTTSEEISTEFIIRATAKDYDQMQ